MIFSSFRKKKWEHKNPHVRISAIHDLLSVSSPEHKAVLLSLAEQDDNELVRRAALTQLADFTIFVEHSVSNLDDKIKTFCTKQVDEILAGTHNIKASIEDKLTYTSKLNNKARLEDWLHHETETNVVIALYEKLAKPQLLLPTYTHKVEPTIQAYFVKQADTIELLEKMLKKTQHEATISLINEKLELLKDRIEKPIKLKKKAQLVLSKLLSLKDISVYEEVLTKQQVLTQEWDECVNDFSLLVKDESKTLTDKYQHITHQLEQLFQEKSEKYQQDLITKKLHEERETAHKKFKDALTELNQDLTRCIFETEVIDEAVYQQKLSQLFDDINASVLMPEDKQALLKQVEKQSHILESLPVIALSITEATHLISAISQLVLPTTLAELNERFETYQAWEASWKAVLKKSNGVLPSSILDAHKQISHTWKTGLHELLAEQKNTFYQVQKKIKEFNRLTEAGKFKPSFYVYKKVTELYTLLSTKQKERLERDYDAVEKKHAELLDWEHYISTPRKQALLDEVKNLIENPKDNPNEQAKEVKSFRQKWNALGHAEESVEHELNEAFNLACEEAFAPCRLFYKEQENLRANNLITREKLLNEAQDICKSLLEQKETQALDWKTVESQIQQLKRSWQNAGEVEREHYTKLNKAFQACLKPVLNMVNAQHEDNARLKLALIASAEKVLLIEDITKAVNEVKALQQAWKKIGFCGSNQENKLWQKFRKINDEVFAKRDQKQVVDKALQKTLVAEFEAKINTLKEQFEQAGDVDELKAVQVEIQTTLTQVNQHKPALKSVSNVLFQLDKKLKQSLETLHNESAKTEVLNAFNLLELFANQEIKEEDLLVNDLYISLSTNWQKTFKKLVQLDNDTCREDKTLALEILANIESPEAFKAQRLQMQVSLLQESLVNGEELDVKKLLKEWILQGKLTTNDLPLLKRIAPIYC